MTMKKITAAIIHVIAFLLTLVTLISMLACGASATDSPVYDRTGYPNTYTNTGDYAVDLVNAALTQVGYQENPDALDYTKYSNWFFGEDTSYPWCGIFVSWCADQAGIPTDIIYKNKHVYSATYDNYSEKASDGDYFGGTPYAFGSKTPAPGDLFFSTTKSEYPDSSTHVGIIWKVDSNYIYTIEGNTLTSNEKGQKVGSVATRMYNRKTGYQYYSGSSTTSTYVHILFYVHPDYEAKSAQDTQQSARLDSVGGFQDVSTSSYYADAVAWAVSNGITAGTSATTFSPNTTCTRSQAVTFLYRYSGSDEQITSDRFSDVLPNSYYYYPCTWAYLHRITAGTSESAFSPEQPVTRAQIVTFLHRYAGCPESENDQIYFSDVSPDSPYADAICWAAASGITYGTSETTFSPDENCTRAQIVTFLYRYWTYTH